MQFTAHLCVALTRQLMETDWRVFFSLGERVVKGFYFHPTQQFHFSLATFFIP